MGTENAKLNEYVNPAHYNGGDIEPADIVIDCQLGYTLGNAFKYLWRRGLKKYPNMDCKQSYRIDTAKAIWFLKKELNTFSSFTQVEPRHFNTTKQFYGITDKYINHINSLSEVDRSACVKIIALQQVACRENYIDKLEDLIRDKEKINE